MTAEAVARLEKVDLRQVWKKEDMDFTPWLAGNESLELLGETLGIELELEGREKEVGPFRADLLCKDSETGNWVLIENQLERTNHDHLGKMLTYAAGLQAVTIVWISERFTEEHRAALDWLNTITNEHFCFFGLEVELWRIGASPCAPKFNVVSKPNNWSRRIARTIDDAGPSATRKRQLEYWSTLRDKLNEVNGPIRGNREPQARGWMAYSVGRSGFGLSATTIRQKNQLRAGLYISGDNANAFFRLLIEQRDEIEQEYGSELEWEELPNVRHCRISSYLGDVDTQNESDWPRQHAWLAESLNKMYGIFSSRIQELDIVEAIIG